MRHHTIKRNRAITEIRVESFSKFSLSAEINVYEQLWNVLVAHLLAAPIGAIETIQSISESTQLSVLPPNERVRSLLLQHSLGIVHVCSGDAASAR